MRRLWGTVILVGLTVGIYMYAGLKDTHSEQKVQSRPAGGMAVVAAKGDAKVGAEALADHSASQTARNLGQPDRDNFTPRVQQIMALATRMAHPGFDAEAVDAEVDKLARELTLADAVQLEEIAMSTERTHDARYLAVYLMAERPEVFAHQLEDIAASENGALTATAAPHTQLEQQRHFEEALRGQALSALDQLNPQGPREEGFFKGLQATHSSSFVRKLARMGALGARQGQSLITQYTKIVR